MATQPFDDAGIVFDDALAFNGGTLDATITGISAATAASTSLAPSVSATTDVGTVSAAAATSTAPAPTAIASSMTVTSDAAVSAAVSPAPSVSAISDATIASGAASSTSAAVAPSSVVGGTIIDSPAPAAATAAGLVPSVATSSNVTVAADVAYSVAASPGATIIMSVAIDAPASHATAVAPVPLTRSFIDPGSTLTQPWTALVLNPDGNEYVINPIADVTVNETFERVTATIDVPWHASGLPSVTDLVSDIVLVRGTTKMYRLRVLDSEDVLTRETHTVRLSCCSYEEILRTGRIIYESDEMTGDQLSLAWDIVQAAQARQDLGITRYPTPAGTSKTVQLIAGATVAETIDKFAAEDDGFDWWIDQDLKFHAQEPRRESVIDFEWTWGAEIAEMTRQSSVEQYVSATYVTGATMEVTIPGGSTYPPPSPAVREVNTMPYGRWEKTFSYPNIVTNASLVKRADWHLGVGSRLRPTYTVVLEQGIWSPSIKLGGIVSIRAQANDRVNFKVAARIEELSLTISPDAAEVVTMLLRAEDEEIYIGTGTPAEVTATNTPPSGSTVVAVPDPTGLSKTLARISPVDWLGSVISSLADRLAREERT